MIGGQWYFNSRHANLTTLITAARLNQAAGFFLLSSKFLWRQGYVRCPEYCSLDTPAADCSCTRPSAITGDRDPLELLSETGLLYLNNGWLRGDFLEKAAAWISPTCGTCSATSGTSARCSAARRRTTRRSGRSTGLWRASSSCR